MNIVVCVKLTPDAGDIEVRSDGSISLERAEWGIGSFDLQAVEAGVSLVEAQGGKVIALSAGPQKIDNSKLKKDILSRGPEELVMIVDDALAGADTAFTSTVLAQAVRKLGEIDLVLCGEGSADLYFQQVGLHLGEKLGWPTLNAVSKIEVNAGGLLAERSLESEVEVLEVPLPAVLSVTTDINSPRLPGMKEILRAGQKKVTFWSLGDLDFSQPTVNQIEVLSVTAPPQIERKNKVIEGAPDEAVTELINYLNKEGIL